MDFFDNSLTAAIHRVAAWHLERMEESSPSTMAPHHEKSPASPNQSLATRRRPPRLQELTIPQNQYFTRSFDEPSSTFGLHPNQQPVFCPTVSRYSPFHQPAISKSHSLPESAEPPDAFSLQSRSSTHYDHNATAASPCSSSCSSSATTHSSSCHLGCCSCSMSEHRVLDSFNPLLSECDQWSTSSHPSVSEGYIPTTDEINRVLAQLNSRPPDWATEDNNMELTPIESTSSNYISSVMQQLASSSAASSPTSSTFTSPRGSSARSSYSRGSVRAMKRSLSSLSRSPSDGSIDINTIIRTSPTSLVAYLNGSRSSSASGGSFGHLSTKNSVANSPNSGSSSRRFSFSEATMLTSQDLVQQALQELEQTTFRHDMTSFNQPDQSNLVVIEQMSLPQIKEEDVVSSTSTSMSAPSLPFSLPEPLPPSTTVDFVEPKTFTESPFTKEPSPIMPQPIRPPPPSYEQHLMIRRRNVFQTMHSSDSSLPSNYSSFDSSGSEQLLAEFGEVDSTTDATIGRSFDCCWIDCGLHFEDQESFVKHIEKIHVDQRQNGDDLYVCHWQNCLRKQRPFNARYKLLIHMRVHSGEKPNRCTFEGCAKAFSRLENLKIHLRSHTGERPYTCQYLGCHKAFSNSSDRAKHQRTHQDTKPYGCTICGCNKRYTDPSSLRKHLKNHNSIDTRKKIRSLTDSAVYDCPATVGCSTGRAKLEHNDSGYERSPRSSSMEHSLVGSAFYTPPIVETPVSTTLGPNNCLGLSQPGRGFFLDDSLSPTCSHYEASASSYSPNYGLSAKNSPFSGSDSCYPPSSGETTTDPTGGGGEMQELSVGDVFHHLGESSQDQSVDDIFPMASNFPQLSMSDSVSRLPPFDAIYVAAAHQAPPTGPRPPN